MRRSSEQATKHIVEYAHIRAQHRIRKYVAENLPVLQVRWLEMQCDRHGCRDT